MVHHQHRHCNKILPLRHNVPLLVSDSDIAISESKQIKGTRDKCRLLLCCITVHMMCYDNLDMTAISFMKV